MSDEGRIETDALLADLEKKIYKEYEQAKKEVQDKLLEYLSEFAEKDEKWREKVKAGKITEEEYQNWRRNQILVGQRWQDMETALARDMHRANLLANAMIQAEKPDVYAINYNYGTYEAETGAGVDTGFVLYDYDTVSRMIKDDPEMLPPPGKKLSERIAAGKDILWNKQLIQSVMTQGILQGETIAQIADRLATSVSDSNRASAIRNARTMTTGAECAGRVNSYKRAEKMGIEMTQQWVATLDGRTRDSHVDLDGERIKVGGKFSNGCRFPADPLGKPAEVYNCRCTLIAQVAGYETDIVSERQVDPYLKGMTYSEWKDTHNQSVKKRKKEANKTFKKRMKGK